jgi:hypothetical protein
VMIGPEPVTFVMIGYPAVYHYKEMFVIH